jgi:hypothetical protein
MMSDESEHLWINFSWQKSPPPCGWPAPGSFSFPVLWWFLYCFWSPFPPVVGLYWALSLPPPPRMMYWVLSLFPFMWFQVTIFLAACIYILNSCLPYTLITETVVGVIICMKPTHDSISNK